MKTILYTTTIKHLKTTFYILEAVLKYVIRIFI